MFSKHSKPINIKQFHSLIMKKPFVIFDMDGVLIHSIPEHYHSYKVLFARYGIDYKFSEFDVHDLTSGVMHVIPRVMHGKSFDLEKMITEKNKLIRYDKIRLNSGVLPLIRQLKKDGYKIAVASGGSRDFLNKILKKRKIYNYFDVIVTGDDHVRKKPFPDIFLKAAKKLGAKPSECIVIEDTKDGVTAARRAGMKVIGHFVPMEKQDLSKANKIVKGMAKIDIKLILRLMKKE